MKLLDYLAITDLNTLKNANKGIVIKIEKSSVSGFGMTTKMAISDLENQLSKLTNTPKDIIDELSVVSVERAKMKKQYGNIYMLCKLPFD